MEGVTVKLVGENMNVMSKTLGPAMRERDAGPIRKMAENIASKNVDFIDINLGPARKQGAEMMEWVVKTVNEVTDIPLFLDTSNVEAMEAGLKVVKRDKGKPVINSVSARPERMEALFPLAKTYEAGVVALLLGVDGIPRDENERGILWSELMVKCTEFELAPQDVYVDPIVLPVNTQQNQVQGCTNFMMMFRDIAPGYSSTCGLSNISNGAPEHLRPILNQTYSVILNHLGMESAIVDAFDADLTAFARGGKAEIRDLILKAVNGEDIDTASLSKDMLDYVKTAKLLLGQSLYSDSWLEL